MPLGVDGMVRGGNCVGGVRVARSGGELEVVMRCDREEGVTAVFKGVLWLSGKRHVVGRGVYGYLGVHETTELCRDVCRQVFWFKAIIECTRKFQKYTRRRCVVWT